MKEIKHQLIMLKPMQAGLSGYARLQGERGGLQLQMNARGLRCGSVRAFWYCSGGEVKELGEARVNARGEAALTAEAPVERVAPERLQALLLVDGADEPRPLMIGLCVRQSAGSLLDAKNASLSLCEKLGRARREALRPLPVAGGGAGTGESAGPTAVEPPREGLGERKQPRESASTAPGAGTGGEATARHGHGLFGEVESLEAGGAEREPTPSSGCGDQRPGAAMATPKESSGSGRRGLWEDADPPREIFLPAIDPLPYVAAQTEAIMSPGLEQRTENALPKGPRGGEPGVPKPPIAPDPVASRRESGNGPGRAARRSSVIAEAIVSPGREQRAENALPKGPRGGEPGAPKPPSALRPTPHIAATGPDAPENPERPFSRGMPVEGLRRLCWPRPFEQLREYFERLLPCAVFDLPGWRFVCTSRQGDGLWIGYQAMDGAVRRVAYAMRGEPPPDDSRPYQMRRGTDGALYRVLVQRAT